MEKDKLEADYSRENAVVPDNPGNRIGLLGGTFDPVHKGHMALAEGVAGKLSLDTLLFVPAALNPLKREQHATPFEQRVAMLNLAVQSRDDFFVSTIEGHRPPPSFTIDTIREFRQVLGPVPELFLIIGSDAFSEIDRWKEGRTILEYAHLVVVPRPPFHFQEVVDIVPAVFPHFAYDIIMSAWVEENTSGAIYVLDLPPLEISSTQIRATAGDPEAVKDSVDQEVVKYILDRDLYEGEQ